MLRIQMFQCFNVLCRVSSPCCSSVCCISLQCVADEEGEYMLRIPAFARSPPHVVAVCCSVCCSAILQCVL